MFVEELFSVKGKIVVVIGGGGVLGGALAEGFARAGARVAVLSRTREKAEKQASHIREVVGCEALAIQVDASQKEDLLGARDQVISEWQGVDVLINAPGINSSTAFLDIMEKEWHHILDANLKSIFLACQIFGETLVQQGRGGSIINFSSTSSGPPLSKVFTYGISKAGVNNLTQFLAREWALYKIRVNAIAPGFFPAEQNRKILSKERTEAIFAHTPMQRFGQPEELVGTAIWLAAEKASSFVTGAIIRVDGGFSAMTI
ncbi:MAG: SDR family oxidoreductase [bacterium]